MGLSAWLKVVYFGLGLSFLQLLTAAKRALEVLTSVIMVQTSGKTNFMYREKNLLTKKKYIVIVIYTVGKKYVKTNFSVSYLTSLF